jgi:hypothetical protein
VPIRGVWLITAASLLLLSSLESAYWLHFATPAGGHARRLVAVVVCIFLAGFFLQAMENLTVDFLLCTVCLVIIRSLCSGDYNRDP